jgi:hypothetical protein
VELPRPAPAPAPGARLPLQQRRHPLPRLHGVHRPHRRPVEAHRLRPGAHRQPARLLLRRPLRRGAHLRARALRGVRLPRPLRLNPPHRLLHLRRRGVLPLPPRLLGIPQRRPSLPRHQLPPVPTGVRRLLPTLRCRRQSRRRGTSPADRSRRRRPGTSLLHRPGTSPRPKSLPLLRLLRGPLRRLNPLRPHPLGRQRRLLGVLPQPLPPGRHPPLSRSRHLRREDRPMPTWQPAPRDGSRRLQRRKRPQLTAQWRKR